MPPALLPDSVAGVIARCLKARGIDRVFGLCGGHVMPIWMRLDAEGIAIVDVRDERAAVYMAHAYGELTGRVGVALVTAGPGMTCFPSISIIVQPPLARSATAAPGLTRLPGDHRSSVPRLRRRVWSAHPHPAGGRRGSRSVSVVRCRGFQGLR